MRSCLKKKRGEREKERGREEEEGKGKKNGGGKGRIEDKKEGEKQRRGITEKKGQDISRPQFASGKRKVLEFILLCDEILEEPKQFCPSP